MRGLTRASRLGEHCAPYRDGRNRSGHDHGKEAMMAEQCTHTDAIKHVTPSAKGCEECLKTGDAWLHLRLCRSCGHVGCCDESPNKHATAHFRKTQHPVIEGY